MELLILAPATQVLLEIPMKNAIIIKKLHVQTLHVEATQNVEKQPTMWNAFAWPDTSEILILDVKVRKKQPFMNHVPGISFIGT